jgi:oligopeptide transport system substrate-binding protein
MTQSTSSHLCRSLWATALVTFVVGCSKPLPPYVPPPSLTPTITPRPTATVLPTATAVPSPTPAPPPTLTPTPSAGYYRNPELGFWFLYPEGWLREETGDNLPSVIINDNDDPIHLLAGGRILEEDTELADFARDTADELNLAEDIELVTDGPTTIANGIPAWAVTFTWEDEKGNEFQAQGYAAISGGKGYVLLLTAHSEVLTTRPNTIQAIGQTLHLEEPELFGISRANALVLLADNISTLDPVLTQERADGIVGHIFSGLVRINADLCAEPDLAESWEVSGDGTVYTFHLRPNATFHSGSPVTANDVKLAWERATDPELGSLTAALYLGDIVGIEDKLTGDAEGLAGVEVLDEHTLVVTLNGPKPYFLAKLAQPVAFVTQADNVTDGPNWWRHPDGSGPFTLHRWREKEALILDRNEAYYQSPPAISAIVYLLSGGSGFLAYEAGHVDIATVDSRNLTRVKDPSDPLSGDLTSGNTFCTYRVVFDTTRPPFDDPAIRRAFALAIDREKLAQVVLNGAATPATGFLPPGMPGYVERGLADTYDVKAALALIAASDYASPATLPRLTLTAPGVGEPDPLAVALTDMWTNDLGVTIRTALVDQAEYIDTIVTQHGHLLISEWCADYSDPENVLDLPYHSDSPANFGRYTNTSVDTLLETARTEPEPGKRLALYQEAETLLLEDAAAIPIVHPLAHVLVRPYVHGYRLPPIPVLWPLSVTIER